MDHQNNCRWIICWMTNRLVNCFLQLYTFIHVVDEWFVPCSVYWLTENMTIKQKKWWQLVLFFVKHHVNPINTDEDAENIYRLTDVQQCRIHFLLTQPGAEHEINRSIRSIMKSRWSTCDISLLWRKANKTSSLSLFIFLEENFGAGPFSGDVAVFQTLTLGQGGSVFPGSPPAMCLCIPGQLTLIVQETDWDTLVPSSLLPLKNTLTGCIGSPVW